MVNKEILLLGTNDVNFVNRFLGLFHEMGKSIKKLEPKKPYRLKAIAIA